MTVALGMPEISEIDIAFTPVFFDPLKDIFI